MFLDDDLPSKPKAKPLDAMSVEELKEMKAMLLEQIAKIDGMIASKQDWRKTADQFFKKGD